MITHIVMFKFKSDVSQGDIAEAKSMIESLINTVSTLKSMEVGINFADEDRAMDMVLVSRFESKDGLEEYAVHEEHQKVIKFIKTIAEYSKVVDYEA